MRGRTRGGRPPILDLRHRQDRQHPAPGGRPPAPCHLESPALIHIGGMSHYLSQVAARRTAVGSDVEHDADASTELGRCATSAPRSIGASVHRAADLLGALVHDERAAVAAHGWTRLATSAAACRRSDRWDSRRRRGAATWLADAGRPPDVVPPSLLACRVAAGTASRGRLPPTGIGPDDAPGWESDVGSTARLQHRGDGPGVLAPPLLRVQPAPQQRRPVPVGRQRLRPRDPGFTRELRGRTPRPGGRDPGRVPRRDGGPRRGAGRGPAPA